MVNIRLNAGSTTLGRDDLGGVKVELTSRFGDDALKKALGQVSREQAAFHCSAAGVTVRNLRQNPSVGVQQATGDWEWLKEGDESLLVPGMRVTFFRSRVLREAASFVLVQHAGAYELTTGPAPPPATAATAAIAATAAEAAAAAAIGTASAAPATDASLAPPASPPPADAAAAAPAAAANLQRDLLPTDPPDARTPAATKRERPGASDAPPAASRAKRSPGDSAAGGPAFAWEATRESSRRRSMRISEGEIADSQGEVRIAEGEVRISEEEIAEAIKEGIVEGVGGMDGGAAAAQPKEEEAKEEQGSGLDLRRAFDGRTVYLNKLEGVAASEGGGAPAIVARPELVGEVARLATVLLTSYGTDYSFVADLLRGAPAADRSRPGAIETVRV